VRAPGVCADGLSAIENHKILNMKNKLIGYLTMAVVAIVAVYSYNTFIAPKANLPTA
jgi:hypothetical protein